MKRQTPQPAKTLQDYPSESTRSHYRNRIASGFVPKFYEENGFWCGVKPGRIDFYGLSGGIKRDVAYAQYIRQLRYAGFRP